MGATAEDRAKFERMGQLHRMVFAGRATVDCRNLSARKKAAMAEHETLTRSMDQQVLADLYAEATATWEAANELARARAQDRLQALGLAEGDPLEAHAGSWLGWMSGHTYHGKVKVSKYGQVYVAAQDPLTGKGARYDLFGSAEWHKPDPA